MLNSFITKIRTINYKSVKFIVGVFFLFQSFTLHAQLDKYVVAGFTRSNVSSTYGQPQILLTSIFADGIIDWGQDKSLRLSVEGAGATAISVIDDKEGGVYVLYSNELLGGDANIALRRISSKGKELLGDAKNPTLFVTKSKNIEKNPKALVLDDGSLMIFYEVYYSDNRDIDIAAARISKKGEKIWASNIWVANSSNKREKLVGVVSDGRSGAIVVVETTNLQNTTQVAEGDIIAVHIDMAGKAGWEGNSVAPINIAASKHAERNASVQSNGQGGVVVAYELEYTSGSRIYDVDIFAQNISAVGKKLWGDSPVAVSSVPKVREYAPVTAFDKDGFTVAFEMLLLNSDVVSQMVGVQRLDMNGKQLWNEGKKAKFISIAKRVCEKPVLVPDGVGGSFMMFEVLDSSNQDRDIYGQRLNVDGSDMWGDALPEPIISSTTGIEQGATAIVVKNNALFIAAVRSVNINIANAPLPNRSLVVQKITLEGGQPWKELNSPITLITDRDIEKKISVTRVGG